VPGVQTGVAACETPPTVLKAMEMAA
jgi:hypothetical protein